MRTELAGSGTLTPDEHHQYVAFTVETMRELYAAQPHARYVAAFQNWLRPAGASFDHLHKQLVAIDEFGPRIDQVLAYVTERPQVFNDLVDHAGEPRPDRGQERRCDRARRRRAPVPVAGGVLDERHNLPWEHAAAEVRAVSDLLHGLHAATGTTVPTNEEWHHRPVTARGALPWHVVLKWRTSTLAGFEGGTKIYVNTLDPAAVRSRVVFELRRLREAGAIAQMRVGEECSHAAGQLRYAG